MLGSIVLLLLLPFFTVIVGSSCASVSLTVSVIDLLDGTTFDARTIVATPGAPATAAQLTFFDLRGHFLKFSNRFLK